MDTTGLEGHTTMVSARSRASSTPGPGRAVVGPLEPDAGHRDVVAEPHEVLLKADLGPSTSCTPGAEGIVGDREQRMPTPKASASSRVTSPRVAPSFRRWVR